MSDIPNFSKYSLGDLEDIYKHIDKEKYPEKTKAIVEEINKKKDEYNLRQESKIEEPKELTDEEKKKELIKLVSIASLVFLFSSYTVFTYHYDIFNQFNLALIPLFIILILSLLSMIFLIRRNYIGVELLKYSQIPLLFCFLLGKFYYFSNLGYLLMFGIRLGDGFNFTFDINFGKFQFNLGIAETKYYFLFAINIIPAILFAHLKWSASYYKKIFYHK